MPRLWQGGSWGRPQGAGFTDTALVKVMAKPSSLGIVVVMEILGIMIIMDIMSSLTNLSWFGHTYELHPQVS